MFRFILGYLFLLEIKNGTDLSYDLSKSYIYLVQVVYISGAGFSGYIRNLTIRSFHRNLAFIVC